MKLEDIITEGLFPSGGMNRNALSRKFITELPKKHGGKEIARGFAQDILDDENEEIQDIKKIVERGILFGKTHKMMKGAPSQCHSNSALCWDENRDNTKIATGFALSTDGIWREHSWVVLQKKDKPSPNNPNDWYCIETTRKRVKYFGFIMTEAESEQFLFDNS